MSAVDYVPTTFLPVMFDEEATAHIKIVESAEAQSLVDETTKVLANPPGHERLVRNQLLNLQMETAGYAMLKPGVPAIHLHYRGPQVGDDGRLAISGMVTFNLIEIQEYQAVDAA